MPSIYRPRRARASPLWHVVHHAWGPFLAEYETVHRKNHGPLRKDAVAVVDQFYKCGDLAAGFTRLQCPDCGHEKLLAFSCKTRHFCPSCHQRKVKQVGRWIAYDVCFNLPHRQFVFTMPKPLRGIFRKRRKLLDLLFQEATTCLRDWFRARLDLPRGELAAIAGVQTFGDYLGFHPHLHVIAPTGLIDKDGIFHEMPIESVKPLEELFRHRFLASLRREKLISETKLRQLLGWTHSGFNLDAGEEPIASHDPEGRRRLAEWKQSGHRLPSGSPKGERSESISPARPVLLGKDYLERIDGQSDLLLQSELAYEAKLPNLHRGAVPRRRHRAYPAQGATDRSLLRSIFQQTPGHGRQSRSSSTRMSVASPDTANRNLSTRAEKRPRTPTALA